MLGVIPPMGKKRKPFLSPAATPQCPILLPVFRMGDSLNLSPSLTSPARGLSHCLLPEGKEELYVLFEDVWVTPKTTHTKVSRLPRHDPTDLLSEGEAVVRHEGVAVLPGGGGGHHLDPQATTSPSEVEDQQRSTPAQWQSLHQGSPSSPSTPKEEECQWLYHVLPHQQEDLALHSPWHSVYCGHQGAGQAVARHAQAGEACLLARRFSRQQNRNVRSELVEGEGDREEEDCVPTPSTCCWPRETCVLQPEEAPREATS
ncbi:uncharacterized protein LOC118391299 [Oncorhynchus keta]|uniref:uncharacterized protein LOC118391299 n=1 Tax=Oncorhynchus keta TaxID=8018 RepID=UPI0015FCE0B9|nr:uncharacterized protein LOC118391299 [Oncorhynchus keta]